MNGVVRASIGLISLRFAAALLLGLVAGTQTIAAPARQKPSPEAQRALEFARRGQYAQAEPLIAQLLKQREEKAGAQSAATLAALNNIGWLYIRQGRYGEAEPVLLRALAGREQVLGADSVDVAQTLDNLANLYVKASRFAEADARAKAALAIAEKTRKGARETIAALTLRGQALTGLADYAEAEKVLRRAVDLARKSLGAGHPDGAKALAALAGLYRAEGRPADEWRKVSRQAQKISTDALGLTHPDTADALGLDTSESTLRRALAIREKFLGKEHPDVAANLLDLGGYYANQGEYQRAESLLRRALAIRERAFGADNREVVKSLVRLGDLMGRLGRFDEAETLLQRALASGQTSIGSDHPEFATVMMNVANSYNSRGQFQPAEDLQRKALAIFTRVFGETHRTTIAARASLAATLTDEGRLGEADAAAREALSIAEKTYGASSRETIQSLLVLSNIAVKQSRYNEAEPLRRRALELQKQAFGSRAPAVGDSLGRLSLIYAKTGKTDLSIAIARQSLTILERAFGKSHPRVASALTRLANAWRGRNLRTSEKFLKQSLAILEKKYGPHHPLVGAPLGMLGQTYTETEEFGKAIPVFERALAIREAAFGKDHVLVGETLNNLGYAYYRTGRNEAAVSALERARDILEKTFGQDNISVAFCLSNLSRAYRALGRLDPALDLARRAVTIVGQRVDRIEDTDDRRAGEQSEKRIVARVMFGLLEALDARVAGRTEDSAIVEEALFAAQSAASAETARTLAGMTARYATEDGELGQLVRERQDAQRRWNALDEALVSGVGEDRQRLSPATESDVRTELGEIDQRLTALNAKLARDFPAFVELSSARPARLANVQAALLTDEALAFWAVGKEESYAFVIRKTGATFFRAPRAEGDVRKQVARLRDSLDARNRPFIELPPFDVAAAHDLYDAFLAPAGPVIAGARRLLIVPSGPLQSLPPSVLVSEAPAAPITGVSDYSKVAWLGRSYAISVLPAVSSLPALRQLASTRAGSQPFMGFGDPKFRDETHKDKDSHKDDKDGELDLQKLFRGARADVKAVSQLPALPDTATELRAEAEAIGAPDASVVLGEEATVARVKSADLSDVRVLAFATHGLIAGELPALAEPALALTPPQQPTEGDDGLLRASDISKLRLNADWVVLSACNTAAADGSSGAEGLSGLAKSFFYAGARSLLVSHWHVDSAATVKLMTGAFRAMRQQPGLGRAQALRQSMLAMIDGAGKDGASDYDAHPLYWAPFVLVGLDGAAQSGE